MKNGVKDPLNPSVEQSQKQKQIKNLTRQVSRYIRNFDEAYK